jgi:hypothetical protein
MATQALRAPLFSRITSKGRPTSWAVGMPFTFIIVLLIGLFAYFASKATSYGERLSQAQNDLATQQRSLDAATKRVGQAEADLVVLRNPGLTTVTLQAPAPAEAAKPSKESKAKAKSKDEEKPASTVWASATWGDLGGRAFVLLRAYGLAQPPAGKTYQAWYEATGKPQSLGVLDPGPTGSAFLEGKDLAPAAQARRVFVALGAEGANEPEAGPPLMEAKLSATPPAAHATPEGEK